MGSILLRTKYDPIYSDVRLLYPIILNVINMKVVLLAGGFGSRISEESQFKPKPMIEIGGMPILWHIMKEYAYYGHTEFIICAGYKQDTSRSGLPTTSFTTPMLLSITAMVKTR